MSFVKHLITGPEKVKTSTINKDAFKLQDYKENENLINADKEAVANRALTQIDTVPQNQFRDTQVGLGNYLAGQVAGTAPSVAQNQLQQGREANIKAAMAMAGSNAGSPVSSGARNTARALLEGNAATNRDAANLRINEQNTAANTLAGVAATGRQADIGLAQSQAQLTVQEQAQKDAIVQQYLAMGINLDQAQSLANQELERMKLAIRTGNAQATNQQTAAITGAVASAAAAAATGGK